MRKLLSMAGGCQLPITGKLAKKGGNRPHEKIKNMVKRGNLSNDAQMRKTVETPPHEKTFNPVGSVAGLAKPARPAKLLLICKTNG
jgi:hypothetical protein